MSNWDYKETSIENSLNDLVHRETWEYKLEIGIILLEADWSCGLREMSSFLLKIDSTIDEDIHNTFAESRLLGHSCINDHSVNKRIVVEGGDFEETVAQELGDYKIVNDRVDGRLEELIHENLNGNCQNVYEPSYDCNHEVSWKLNIGISQVEVGVPKSNRWCACMRICGDDNWIIEKSILKNNINIEPVFNRPYEDIEALEVELPIGQFGPWHNDGLFVLVNCEFGTSSIKCEVSERNVINLEEAKEETYVGRNHWCDNVIRNVR